ncbi:hypothetical protein HGA13_20685 [Nocardia speluncae]|uniref:Excreted virulence factor EspC (Type VII ESX diderm) n=1 Tax=Nocardia speluncae TaxID=419477 RepID=A0A846XIX6_9NOCA|nr:hypothetical protein [Nocardia speluncae]NKY35467.1 hypothetical protein [Nocardia speluncae]
MTSPLQVDIDLLDKAAQSVRGAEQVLTDAMASMAEDGHGDIGTTELNDAADSFRTRWKFGIERIGDAAAVTADGITACANAYRQLDDAVAAALGETGNAISSRPTVQITDL